VVASPVLDCRAAGCTVGGELSAVEEGNPDGGGQAVRNNIKPGSCLVYLPDLDGEAWESV